ncbi:hypothetical protein LIER_28066 [Lithospermum erythrorhizon]|uniref:Uncharacterized protein n=1 Tax=Lithospermum erythrorhizon TaxID=34254 RepID=A0AAV3RHR6_LITER
MIEMDEKGRPQWLGKSGASKGGCMNLWHKVAKNLPITVHHKTEVVSVKRELSCIKVDVKNDNSLIQHMEFDKIIISGSFPINSGRAYGSPCSQIEESSNDLMDFSPLEKELFSKVQYIHYYTSVLKIKGFEHIPVGFYYFKNDLEQKNSSPSIVKVV